jgi:CRISPR/Cas system-associated protein Cas10 (large subunit of type III CRISPR-Cas system)
MEKFEVFKRVMYSSIVSTTSFNPEITLSAGITLENPKFPIIRAGRKAEEQLDKAKHSEYPSHLKNTKNKISLFGYLLKWDWSQEKEEEELALSEANEERKGYYRNAILQAMEGNNETKVNEF